jgi:hypothetical protein
MPHVRQEVSMQTRIVSTDSFYTYTSLVRKGKPFWNAPLSTMYYIFQDLRVANYENRECEVIECLNNYLLS